MNKFRNNYKKVTSLLLIIIMLFSCVSFAYPSAFAAGTEYTKDGYTYTVSGANATIVAYTTSSSGKITIPSKLNGYTVTTIGARAFYACTKLTEIIIPNTVTKIEDYAFSMCFDLITCKIPSSVKSIGKDIFSFNDEVVIECEEGSVAWQYAKDNGLSVKKNGKYSISLSESAYLCEINSEIAISGELHIDDISANTDLKWVCSDPYGVRFNLPASMLNITPNDIVFSAMVKGLKAGKYTITVATVDGTKASCEFQVCNYDTDGDGLRDIWEIKGLDITGDGKPEVDLKAMGADPNVPDLFVEVDWMVRPQKKVVFFETQAQRDLRPSESSMRMVYNAFRAHNINIHIDVGPNSTDFVTGKKWGSLSGGNEIAYVDNFELGRNNLHWKSTVYDNMSIARQLVFRHCIFANQYEGSTSSGIASGIPGQYFIVANQDWLFSGGDIAIAGTFMHELGHTIGLRHGGCDHEHYKPNYLSIMNYAYQTTGLVGIGRVDYSDYLLPSINEYNINEFDGIDPAGITSGTNLGARLFYRSASERIINTISRESVDFDGDGILERKVSLDLNPGGDVEAGSMSVLRGYNDWENLSFAGGYIGETGDASGVDIDIEIDPEGMIFEKTLEESLATATLAVDGTGYVEFVESTVIKDVNGQNIYFDIVNLGSEESTFVVEFENNKLIDKCSFTVIIPGSKSKLEKVRISIPVNSNVDTGSYNFVCNLKNASGSIITNNFKVSVYNPTLAEINELKSKLEDESIELDEDVVKEISKLSDNSDDCSCNCHAGGIKGFFFKFILFFQKIFRTNKTCKCGISHY